MTTAQSKAQSRLRGKRDRGHRRPPQPPILRKSGHLLDLDDDCESQMRDINEKQPVSFKSDVQPPALGRAKRRERSVDSQNHIEGANRQVETGQAGKLREIR
jgi:hypothetical protein